MQAKIRPSNETGIKRWPVFFVILFSGSAKGDFELIDLRDIGYSGTWDKFCDPVEIVRDFLDYPILEKLRNIICSARRENITDRLLPLFGTYKYCVMIRPRIDEFLENLLKEFSHDDGKLKMRILNQEEFDNTSNCYNETTEEFHMHCIGRENPFFQNFALLLGRTCKMAWLSTEDIRAYVKKVCQGKRIDGHINWIPIVSSINYKPLQTVNEY